MIVVARSPAQTKLESNHSETTEERMIIRHTRQLIIPYVRVRCTGAVDDAGIVETDAITKSFSSAHVYLTCSYNQGILQISI